MWRSEYTLPFSLPNAADRRMLTRHLTAVQSWKPDQPSSVEAAGTAAMLPVEVMASGALSLRQLCSKVFGACLSAIFAPADSCRKN
jgi:hypothetical protein